MNNGRSGKIVSVNRALIAANILVFVVLEFMGSTENAGFMLDHGAMFGPFVLGYRDYYRLFTSMFLHFGAEHLMNNMLVLFVLGEKLEAILGPVRYLIFYILSGTGAGIFSMVMQLKLGDIAVSAGASGAIFGVIGGLIYVIARNRGRLADLTGRQLVLMAALSLYHGFAETGVDNWAHIGGLVTGFFMGILLYRKSKTSGRLR